MYNIPMYVYITYMYVNEYILYIYIIIFFIKWKMYLCCLNSIVFQATDVLNTRSQGQVAAQQKKKR